MKNINLVKFKEAFNNVIDEKIEEASVHSLVETIDNAPFLTCRKTMENLLPELYETKEGKRILRSYVKLLKENEALFTNYIIYDNILKCENVNNPNIFVNACLSLDNKTDNKLLNEGLDKLRCIIKEAVFYTRPNLQRLENILKEEKTLCESLDDVFVKGHNLHNTVNYSNSLNTIIENVKAHHSIETTTSENEYSNSSIKENINKINDILSESDLEEWQRKLISETFTANMAGCNEELFNQYKNKCLQALTESSNDNDESETNKQKMHLMIQQLNEKRYNNDTFLDDIMKLGALLETIKK